MNAAEQYIQDVRSGLRVAGKLEIAAVDRFENMLRLAEHRGLEFNKTVAETALIAAGLFRYTKGRYAGKPFKLFGWQAFVIYNIFGWLEADTGLRKITEVYIRTARKNGKTEFAALIVNLIWFFNSVEGAEFLCAATKRDQAKIAFDAIKKMQRNAATDHVFARKNTKFYKHSVENPVNDSKLYALGKDSDSMDGLFPYVGIIDEYHAHPNSDVKEVLQNGMVAHADPLLLTITTAGLDSECECKKYEDSTCIPVVQNVKEDDSLFVMIFAMDEDDDWEDPKNWVKSNPSLGGGAVLLKNLQREYQKAKNEGARKQFQFIVKNLNRWMDDLGVWMDPKVWASCADNYDLSQFADREAYIGLDLANTSDIAAAVLLICPSDDDPNFYTFANMYCPEDTIKERPPDMVSDYQRWVQNNHIIATPGNVIDYDFISKDIMSWSTQCDLRGVYYDRKFSVSIISDLYAQGLEVVGFNQSASAMNAPIVQLETCILKNTIKHQANPVTTWMLNNIVLKYNAYGDCYFHKGESRAKKGKIDFWPALANAMGGYLQKREQAPDFTIYSMKIGDNDTARN